MMSCFFERGLKSIPFDTGPKFYKFISKTCNLFGMKFYEGLVGGCVKKVVLQLPLNVTF